MIYQLMIVMLDQQLIFIKENHNIKHFVRVIKIDVICFMYINS